MSNDIEYIEPTQEHVGQMVEVRDDNNANWVEAKLTGILQDEFRFAAKRKWDGFSFAWQHARIPRPLTYAERQLRCGLKVGDRVKFVRAWDCGESDGTTHFVQSMQRYIGKIGSLTSISKSSCCVHFDGGGYWYFPYFVLEKVEDRKATNKDFGKTIYVDGNPDDEFKMEFVYQVPCEPWRAVLVKNDKRFVYELSNLRVKE